MQNLAKGTETQAGSLEETDHSANELVSGMKLVAAQVEKVAFSSKQASTTAQDGDEIIKTAVLKMNTIGENVGLLANSMNSLDEKAQNIGNIVQAITDISSQTNLLALNAAIEAARAGENGKGFAVVADEVRKLAEQSSLQASQISSDISAIQTEVLHAVKEMQNSIVQITDGVNVVRSAGDAFSKIQDVVHAVEAQITEVNSSVGEMTEDAVQVLASVDSIKNVAEETAAATQTVSASSEEQLASFEEVTANAEVLASTAEHLEQLLKKFSL